MTHMLLRFFILVLPLIAVHIACSETEPLDINLIYLFQDASSRNPFNGSGGNWITSNLEYHARTNGLGRLAYDSNGSIIDSYIGMPTLGCANAGTQCSWQKNGWTSLNLDLYSVLPHLTVGTTNITEITVASASLCSINNGGCQHSCHEENGGVVCSCFSEYLLQRDQRSCTLSKSCGNHFYGTSGRFTSPRYPYDYPANADCSWLIVSPPNHRIKLSFLSLSTENCCDRVHVYDGNTSSNRLLGTAGGSSIPNVITSSSNMMMITFKSDSGVQSSGFSAVFNTEPIGKPVLVLTSDVGTLTSPPVPITSNGLCVSIAYKLATNNTDDIRVSASLVNDLQLNLTSGTEGTQRNGWTTSRFEATLSPKHIGQHASLSVTVSGKNSAVFSIVGCNPDDKYEDVLVLETDFPEQLLTTSMNKVDISKGEKQGCHNGAIKDASTQKCICPPGFIGSNCMEGCGSNRYGNDCGGVCSHLESGCRNMIFCKWGLGCMCASGFKGPRCSDYCSPGEYGVGCQLQCGHCNSGSCDIFTGRCASTCKPGFYPPLCVGKYKMLTTAPRVKSKTVSTASISLNDVNQAVGQGTSKFYQLQYKEKMVEDWKKQNPERLNSNTISCDILGLQSGIQYEARVILIDTDGNSYQKSDVPVVNFETPCQVPDSNKYHIEYENVTNSSFDISWEYSVLSPTWCPITGYEILFMDRWRTNQKLQLPEDCQVSFLNLSPGQDFRLSVRAHTNQGIAPYSDTLVITTDDDAPGMVVQLNVVASGWGELMASWNSPRATGGTIRRYHVQYQCLQLLACPNSCNSSAGQLEVDSNSVVISGLKLHAQYLVKVAGLAAKLGPFVVAVVTTDDSGATIAPDASEKPVIHASNTSLTVQWSAPANCSGLNGYLQGYQYQLVAASELGKPVIRSGSTTTTNASFSDLVPHTHYQVLVSIVTSGDMTSKPELVIDATTSATIPAQVEELTVYKMGRRMVGIRWAQPLHSFGELKSFTVTHQKVGKVEGTKVKKIITPVHCNAWPQLYCHTINNLEPDTNYLVSVQARNTEVDTDGHSETVKAMTREGAPRSPMNLKVINQTETSLLVEWEMPNMINGVLRSFLVNVEETDSLNASDCCEFYPIQELPVRSEDHLYHLEVNGLRPASTLTISVSAKTVTMGPSANITANTRPERPQLLHAPEVVLPRKSESSPFYAVFNPLDDQPILESTYLLLVLPSDEVPKATIWDEDLSELLQAAVGQNFYLVGEYQQVELADRQEIPFGSGMSALNGTLGHLEDPHLTLGERYRVGMALVLSYGGVFNVGFLASEPFMAQ